MPATTNGPSGYAALRSRRHPDCWVCEPSKEHGLTMEFLDIGSGTVVGDFPCDADFTGYPGLLHGGVTTALLDGAMTNCLMAHGTPGLTARLEVRFLHPVLINKTATVRAWLEKTRGPLSILGAELRQNDEVMATATGRFMAFSEQAKAEE